MINFERNILATDNKSINNDIYTYQILPAGAITPQGWINNQLKKDLTEGYIGVFDNVHKSVTHNVFIKQNRKSNKRFKFRKEWWSGEHEGYWKDAVIRMAFLTNNQAYIDQAHAWMEELLANTGEEGYIGIYKDCEQPKCRFNHVHENGELWATSRILMAMLAYYEYTGKEKVLAAAEKATQLVMEQYADENYFLKISRGGGVSHGIGFFESLEWLYRITGNNDYLKFSKKLYADFNESKVRDDDLQTHHLLNEDRYLLMHGAHIAEGLFVPAYLARLHKHDRIYATAADNTLEKLYYHITPGGAMRCDEWIKGKEGTADEEYEYCGIAEMVSPMNKITSFTGDISLGDRIETMTFNAGQGARFPVLSALSYLTSDNRIRIDHGGLLKREVYDAAHVAAVCCVLNGGRLMPYYVEGMYLKNEEENAVLAYLYGPSEVETMINHTQVKIIQETEYPFDDKAEFSIISEGKKKFSIWLRKPYNAENVKVQVPKGASVKHLDNMVQIEHQWTTGDKIFVNFNFETRKIAQPESKTVPGGGYYFQRGPIVFALPFEYETDRIKEYNNSGFYRYRLKAENKEKWKYYLPADAAFEYQGLSNKAPLEAPFAEPVVSLKGNLVSKNGEKAEVNLVPLGNTIFRRVTFPVYD